ncbi:MAG: ligase-associated DNA damage response endonuclease PdeM [Geminicoccaceae bacterium]|nr:ligase-associated DNA damage response endonuclease PdeM [Geminicoccaceae bacterium]
MTEPCRIRHGGARLLLDPSGVLLFEACRTLVVTDLHLEKGSAFARRGVMLPPYDSDLTLKGLEEAVRRLRPSRIVSLGDAFHDAKGAASMPSGAEARLRGLIATVGSWVWVQGNHDPVAPAGFGGETVPKLAIEGVVLRHEPEGGGGHEIAGHLHPKARAAVRGVPARPCFARGRTTLVLPAFGRLTGGLDVLGPAFAGLFGGDAAFCAYLLGSERLYPLPRRLLLPERGAMQRGKTRV